MQRKHQAEAGGKHREGPHCHEQTRGDLHPEPRSADDGCHAQAPGSLQGL